MAIAGLVSSLQISLDILATPLPSNDYESHLKANFEYNPSMDRTCPCPEAGLAFKRGDILKLISSDDKMWWQASLVNDPFMRCGIYVYSLLSVASGICYLFLDF